MHAPLRSTAIEPAVGAHVHDMTRLRGLCIPAVRSLPGVRLKHMLLHTHTHINHNPEHTWAADASSVTGMPMTPNMCLMPAALSALATRLYPLLPEATCLAKLASFLDTDCPPPGCEFAAALPAHIAQLTGQERDRI